MLNLLLYFRNSTVSNGDFKLQMVLGRPCVHTFPLYQNNCHCLFLPSPLFPCALIEILSSWVGKGMGSNSF